MLFETIKKEDLEELEKVDIKLFIKKGKKVLPFEKIKEIKSYKYDFACDIILNEEEFKGILDKNKIHYKWFKNDRDKNLETYTFTSRYSPTVERYFRRTYINKKEEYIIRIWRTISPYNVYGIVRDIEQDLSVVDILSIISNNKYLKVKDFILDRHKESKIIKRFLLEKNL